MLDSATEAEIRKLALKNALEYGKANTGSVLSKALSKFPDLKSDLRALSANVAAIVTEVNALSAAQVAKEAEQYADEFKSEAEKKAKKSAEHDFTLDGAAEGNFMTRFPPEPNGYMQIGHAKAVFTERKFSDIYRGKLALYFDDTNPEKEKQEFVDSFKTDLQWLGIPFDTEYYASDSIEQLYVYAEQMIKAGKAYVCWCKPEQMSEGRTKGIACEHKAQGAEENLRLWTAMLASKDEKSGMVLRLNYDLKDNNTAMRDPTLFRIKTDTHYRQGNKYHVWPTYGFNTPIMDSLHGITDALRSKEFELMDELYYYVLDTLKLRKPRVHSFARLEIKDNLTSKRKINELIAQGLIWGYDDPRLVTITALRRRGVMPAAIKEFVLRFGMSKTESRVPIEMLLTENRKLLDANAKRLFFVEKPVKVHVTGIPDSARDVKMRLHPTVDMGFRRYLVSDEFFINASDANKISNGDQVRLKDAFDILITARDENLLEAKYVAEATSAPRIHWVNEGNYMACNVYKIGNLLNGEAFNESSLVLESGLVESHAESLLEGEVVQFERTGFFKLDSRRDLSFLSL